MSDRALGAEVLFTIDDTKVTVIRRARRLRDAAVKHLMTLRGLTDSDNTELVEIIAWLGELEV